MLLSRAVVGLAVVVGLSSFSMGVAADVPGPKPECQPSAPGCELCWAPYGGDDSQAAAFVTCKEEKAAKGFKEQCRERQGAGDSVYFCPEGVTVNKSTVNGTGKGGCAACSVGTETASGGIVALVLGIGALVFRRRKERAR